MAPAIALLIRFAVGKLAVLVLTRAIRGEGGTPLRPSLTQSSEISGGGVNFGVENTYRQHKASPTNTSQPMHTLSKKKLKPPAGGEKKFDLRGMLLYKKIAGSKKKLTPPPGGPPITNNQ